MRCPQIRTSGNLGEINMTDVTIFIVCAIFVALTWGLLAMCDWLMGGEA
jgi:hypothetical protein